MKIAFMGTPQFAVPILERILADGHEVCAVFCQPDKPVGRGYKVQQPPVKEAALRYGLPVFQPVKLKDGAVAAQLRALAPDLAVVVAYGRLLPRDVLEAPRLGCINLHASLLPCYRGAAPIQWAIMRGEEKTGVTVMHMAEGLDTGDIILQEETPIGANETAPELSTRLSVLGAQAVARALPLLAAGTAPRRAQDDASATLAPILKKEMGQLDWSRPALELHNLARGLAGWPAVHTWWEGKLLKVHATLYVPEAGGAPGEVLEDKRLLIACGTGALVLTEVQPEGKPRMAGDAFMRGARIKAHARFMNRSPLSGTIKQSFL